MAETLPQAPDLLSALGGGNPAGAGSLLSIIRQLNDQPLIRDPNIGHAITQFAATAQGRPGPWEQAQEQRNTDVQRAIQFGQLGLQAASEQRQTRELQAKLAKEEADRLKTRADTVRTIVKEGGPLAEHFGAEWADLEGKISGTPLPPSVVAQVTGKSPLNTPEKRKALYADVAATMRMGDQTIPAYTPDGLARRHGIRLQEAQEAIAFSQNKPAFERFLQLQGIETDAEFQGKATDRFIKQQQAFTGTYGTTVGSPIHTLATKLAHDIDRRPLHELDPDLAQAYFAKAAEQVTAQVRQEKMVGDIDRLRQNYQTDARTKSFVIARDAFTKMLGSLDVIHKDPTNQFAQFDLVIQWVKINDPDSVVREAEEGRAFRGIPFQERAQQWMRSNVGAGGVMGPKQINNLLKAATASFTKLVPEQLSAEAQMTKIAIDRGYPVSESVLDVIGPYRQGFDITPRLLPLGPLGSKGSKQIQSIAPSKAR